MTDQELIDLFNKDSKNADKVFSVLLNKYQESLYYQVLRIVSNHDACHDILQHVWIKVYKYLGEFKQESSLYTWLYRIAHNETLNYINKEKKSKFNVEISYIEFNTSGDLTQMSPEEMQQLLNEAVMTLPDKQALIFQMKYFEDLKYSEISEKLGTSEGALKASYSIAQKKVEAYLINKIRS